MKRLMAALAALVILPLLFAGCSQGDPGPMKARDFTMSGFRNVEINSMFEVDLVQSDTWGVTVTAQEKLFDQIKVTQSGDTLSINLQWDWGTWVSKWGFQRPRARIAMPDLEVLRLEGATKGTAKGFSTTAHDTDIYLSGASSLDVDYKANNSKVDVSGASRIGGTVKTAALLLNIAGSSSAFLDGSATSIDIEASGASNAALDNLKAGTIHVELSGASKTTVWPTEKLSIDISGASSLTYAGNPSVESIEISGASTVHKK
jgi:hypothetical protein